MKLTRQERWILSNQYKTLQAISETNDYDQAIEALESGFEFEYDSLCAQIVEDTLTEDECVEVIHIMSMYSAIKDSYNALTDNSGIEKWAVKFHGFDGNNEGAQLGYALYLLKDGKFTNLDRGDNFNSHAPMLSSYRRMLAVWKRMDDRKPNLTKAEIIQLLAAFPNPR